MATPSPIFAVADIRADLCRVTGFDAAGKCVAGSLEWSLSATPPHALEDSPWRFDAAQVNDNLVLPLLSAVRETWPELRALALLALTTEGRPPRVTRIVLDPLPVYLVPHILAAAYAVPDSWSSFQLIDPCAGMWWMVEKRTGQIDSARPAPFSSLAKSPAETLEQGKAFGFVNAASVGNDALNLGISVIDAKDLLVGAYETWKQHTQAEGAHISVDPSGREMLRVQSIRNIEYGILHVEQPVFSHHEEALARFLEGRPALFVVDEQVNAIYGAALDEYSRQHLNSAGKILISGSEDRKSWSQVDWICREAARLKFPRQGVVVAVGGGVVLDVAGFAASIYRRGIRYLRIPTSLIGLVDAGLGIKQGVNFAEAKNTLGAFYPPIGAINDVSFLQTLPSCDISCGMAEIIKIALVRSAQLFELLERHGRELLESRFAHPASVAARILRMSEILMLEELQPNLYETDLRRLVDFGHTFSPVIEIESGYRVAHGEAVAVDMLLSTAIAVDRGLCSENLFGRMVRLYEQVGLPLGFVPCSAQHLVRALESARLHRGGNLNLVAPTSPGHAVFLQEVVSGEIDSAMARLHRVSVGHVRGGYGGGI